MTRSILAPLLFFVGLTWATEQLSLKESTHSVILDDEFTTWLDALRSDWAMQASLNFCAVIMTF